MTRLKVRSDSHAAIAHLTGDLAKLLEQRPVETYPAAEEFVRQMLRDGWRPTGAYDPAPPPVDPGPVVPPPTSFAAAREQVRREAARWGGGQR